MEFLHLQQARKALQVGYPEEISYRNIWFDAGEHLARTEFFPKATSKSIARTTMHIAITANASFNIVNFRKGLVKALLKDRHTVVVLAPADDRCAEITELGCRFVPLEMDVKSLSPAKDIALVRRYVRQFRKEQPDVVLGYTIKNNIFGALAARITGTPFVPNITGLGTAFLSGPLLEAVVLRLYREAFRKVPSVVFQNQDDLDLFLDRKLVKPDQVVLVPGSGIDLKQFAPQAAPRTGSPLTFLMISRLLKDKGVVEYVEAARRVRRDNPNVSFQLLGPIGPENRSALDATAVDSWQREGIVTHLGSTRDVRPHIAAANCVVLPSYREGAPRTLIEAAAMARPVITTDVTGCRTVVEDGVNGYLCQVRDASSLTDACHRFIRLTSAERDAMGAAGRQKMEREFNQELVIEVYRRILRDIKSASLRSGGANPFLVP